MSDKRIQKTGDLCFKRCCSAFLNAFYLCCFQTEKVVMFGIGIIVGYREVLNVHLPDTNTRLLYMSSSLWGLNLAAVLAKVFCKYANFLYQTTGRSVGHERHIPSHQYFFFIFMHFSATIMPKNRLVPLGKSWIRHCKTCIFKWCQSLFFRSQFAPVTGVMPGSFYFSNDFARL